MQTQITLKKPSTFAFSFAIQYSSIYIKLKRIAKWHHEICSTTHSNTKWIYTKLVSISVISCILFSGHCSYDRYHYVMSLNNPYKWFVFYYFNVCSHGLERKTNTCIQTNTVDLPFDCLDKGMKEAIGSSHPACHANN